VPTVVQEIKYTSVITAAKIGRPSQRLVTIRSILSETLKPDSFFLTQRFTSLAMASYRSLVMMLSLSSSFSFSSLEMISSS
jgi:hypothetical protein